MATTQLYTLTKDVSATVIPAGDVMTLPSGTEVYIVQTLGGNVTVRTDHGVVSDRARGCGRDWRLRLAAAADGASSLGCVQRAGGLGYVENVFRP